MKVSENWLREWVDPPLSSVAIADLLTLAGLEVDGISAAGPTLSGVVVAEVITCERHPNADRLALCKVNDGAKAWQVVCGAPNARAGMKTAFARPGAQLSDEREIAQTQIRGVESNGLLCSAAELGLGDDAAGIIELPSSASVGTELAEFLQLDDAIFDIGLTPNRGDCFCTIGIARDLGVLTGLPMSEPVITPVAASCENRFPVVLEDAPACPRYAGRVIAGIDPNATTPPWLQERLRRAGVRMLHPAVDVTNYVMLELGQPMHAFDLGKLSQGIVVRGAKANEEISLLDGQRIILDRGTLVIADGSSAVALAGVMGGADSAVNTTTTDLFLESAYFDPVRLAGVARRHRLHTDASIRFERGVDPSMQVRAVERATALIVDICGGRPGPVTLTESVTHVPARPEVAFRPAAVNRLLGTSISIKRIEEILGLLGMENDSREAVWRIKPPAFRSDIRLEADLVEEVARIEGYDAIPIRLPRAEARPELPVADSGTEHRLRNVLIQRGYFEAITYSFVAANLARQFHPASVATELANPISSDMSIMRPSLWPGLVGAACYNLNRQQEDVRLFEIGMVFADLAGGFSQEQHIAGLRCGLAESTYSDNRSRDADFFDLKQDVEVMLKSSTYHRFSMIEGAHPALHPGQTAVVVSRGRTIGYLGALHPTIADQFDIVKPMYLFEFSLDDQEEPGAPQYRPISRYPAVRRDISIIVDEQISAAACLAAARGSAGEILRDLQLFDVYRGQGIDSDKKSLTLGLIFQDVSSTLRDDEVEAAVARVLRSLHELVGGLLRE